MPKAIECSCMLAIFCCYISRVFDADKISVLILTGSCFKTFEKEDKQVAEAA